MANDDIEEGIDETVPLLDDWDEDIPDLGGNDVVQFSTPIYYFDETDSTYKIDVIRLGTMKGKVAVTLVTKDGSAVSGIHYESVVAQLVFAERVHTRTVEIKATRCQSRSWNPTREFKICLECPQNCDVGTYLHDCRVQIADDDKFPSNQVQAIKSRKGEDDYSSPELFREYCKLNFKMAGVHWKTILILVVDQLMNLFIFLSLWVSVYIVDTLFDHSEHAKKDLLLPNRFHTACIIAMCYVVPVFLLYTWDLVKVWLDVEGASLAFMQLSMMGAYLDFTVQSRLVVTPASISYAVTSCAAAVAYGYVAMLSISRLVGRIAVIAVFLFLYFKDYITIAMAFVMILGLIVFALIRAHHLQNLQMRAEDKFIIVETLVGEISQKYPLVHSYSKRPVMHDMFRRSVQRYINQKRPVDVAGVGTYYITRFLSGIFIAAYIIVKTPAVFANELSLGVFLATIALFSTTLADTISELNNQMLSVIQAFTPLKDLTRYMNLETTLPQLKKITTHRNTLTKLQRQHTFAKVAMASDGDEAAFKTDHINIEISDLCYEFVKGQPVLQHVNLSIAQGQLVSVTGGPRTGKSTFMELLAHSRHPTDGSIMVPSHLRLLHVHQEPMFLRASIFSNLCLGLPAREAVDIDRIFAILQLCGLTEIVDVVNKELKLDEEKKEKEDKQEATEEEEEDHHTVMVHDHDEEEKEYYKKLTPTPQSTPRDTNSARGIQHCRMNEGIKFEKKNKVRAKWETFLTHSQKSKLYICCALISNPNVMLMTKTLDSLHDHSATEMLDVLFQHVKNRGLCLPEESINSRRPLIVFYSTDRSHLAKRADTILRITEDKTITIVPKEEAQSAAYHHRA